MKGKSSGFFKYFWLLVIVVLIFTAIDTLVHATVEYMEIYYYPIPSFLSFISSSPLAWYAMGKFFGSLIIGCLIYPAFIRVKKYPLAIAVFSLTITILLEVRYILSGYYSISWDFYNFLQHTAALYLVSYFVFRNYKKHTRNERRKIK